MVSLAVEPGGPIERSRIWATQVCVSVCAYMYAMRCLLILLVQSTELQAPQYHYDSWQRKESVLEVCFSSTIMILYNTQNPISEWHLFLRKTPDRNAIDRFEDATWANTWWFRVKSLWFRIWILGVEFLVWELGAGVWGLRMVHLLTNWTNVESSNAQPPEVWNPKPEILFLNPESKLRNPKA